MAAKSGDEGELSEVLLMVLMDGAVVDVRRESADGIMALSVGVEVGIGGRGRPLDCNER